MTCLLFDFIFYIVIYIKMIMSIKWARSSILQSVITLTIPTADVHTLINGEWSSIGCMNTVLVMSPTGGMGRVTTTFYKRLASMICKIVNWIHCCPSIHYVNQRSKIISFSFSITCLLFGFIFLYCYLSKNEDC